MFDDRCEDDHDRRIIKESRDECDGGKHPELCGTDRGIALRKKLLDELSESAALAHAFADKKEQTDRNHAFVAEAFEHLFG